MNKWIVRIYHHPLWQFGERLRLHSTQSISPWLVKQAEQIDRVTPEVLIQAIKGIIWRIIISGAIVCLVLSIAIASGYLQFQLPTPQDRNFFLLIGAVGFNLFLTQSLNFKKIRSIIFFILCLSIALLLSHFLAWIHIILMYLYISWLLLFLVPICYWLTIAAFDLVKFRNFLIMTGTIAAMGVYGLAAIIQITDWEVGFDILTIANRFSIYTAIVCLTILLIFGSIAKLLQVSLKLTILSIRTAFNPPTATNSSINRSHSG